MTVSQTNPGGMHGPSPDSYKNCPGPQFRIERVEAGRRNEAVERLVSDPDSPSKEAAKRFLEFAAQNQVHLDAMWAVMGADDSFRRTLLAVPSPGRTAMLFMTRLHRTEELPEAGALIRHSMQNLSTDEVQLAQVLLDPRDELERQAYLLGEFTQLAELSYLERPIPSVRDVKPVSWPAGVTVESCGDPHDPDWGHVLDRSYEQTLDCPALLGLRQTRDIIEGHKSIGTFDPGLWTLLRMDGKPSGVLLLNPVPANRSVELVYLGIVPEARGKGLAALLLHYGFGLLAGRPQRTLTLAVDDNNAPAMRLYHKHGFRRSLRRVALVRSLTQSREREENSSAR